MRVFKQEVVLVSKCVFVRRSYRLLSLDANCAFSHSRKCCAIGIALVRLRVFSML